MGNGPEPIRYLVTERWLREELVAAREGLGWSRRKAAARADMSTRTIERVENGPDPIRPGNVSLLCDAYGIDNGKRAKLLAMCKRSRETAWWDAYRDLPVSKVYQEHCELEEISEKIDMFSGSFFHGLIQSREYAFHVQTQPGNSYSTGQEAERFVELRMERQQRIFGVPGRRLRHLFPLHMPLLGKRERPDIFGRQIEYLAELHGQGVVESRAVPSEAIAIALAGMIHVFCSAERVTCCFSGGYEFHTEGFPGSTARIDKTFERFWASSIPVTEI